MKENYVVYKEEGRYGGWPANHGIWSWGDEILVSFREGVFKDVPGDHSISREDIQRAMFARSLDGGKSWSVCDPKLKIIPPLAKGTKINMDDVTDCPGGLDFSNPDFCATFTMSGTDEKAASWWYWSGDRGNNWNGPYTIPSFEFPNPQARTDYHILNKEELLVFYTVGTESANGREGRVICAKICEGGKRFELIGLVGEESVTEGYSIMPASGIRKNGEIVCLNRIYTLLPDGTKKFFIKQFSSADKGKNWTLEHPAVTDCGDLGGNPPALTVMKDGTWAVAYGVRREPFRMCVRFSEDEGRTWGEEKVLRNDAGCFDFGYCRMTERADGKLVACYYYNTDKDEERFIAATVFDKEL